ncbi:hypothetical protein GS399_09990 [Pedobacter sp. HMF7647]|uniref:Uncharacterized protein n=1 Tax=Hufsiella arboris TaxID=2695275 RepID=A0A7K1YB68_9SPHI|nr:hypothetical protein [Hufsiella arboris]MXV51298.1 hypothetical protein [Hufsiella arboris]
MKTHKANQIMEELRLKRKSTSKKAFIKVSSVILLISMIATLGCKKGKKEDEDIYYGYGKLTVECEKKCHVEYGEGDKTNNYDVEATKATYYFRYHLNYNLNISITPSDTTQTMTLNVFNRETKQIFNNTTRKKKDETWNSTILVP